MIDTKKIVAAVTHFFMRQAPVSRLRLFEIFFTLSFLVYMGRNLLNPLEWLTDYGFHPENVLHGPNTMLEVPLMPVWAVPFFVSAILLSGVVVIAWPQRRRYAFAALVVLGYYAESVDSASAYALNRLYVLGYFFLFLAPDYKGTPPRGPIASVQVFKCLLLTLYCGTGITKVYSGEWLQSSDLIWTHAQGHYCTELCAFALRNLPPMGWAFLQYSVLAFELGAPLWFMWNRTRPFAILFGISFHIGIAAMMAAVWVFSLQMLTFYVLFIPDSWAEKLLRRFRSAKLLFR